jgi:type VI secretion system secreted protein VgrG
VKIQFHWDQVGQKNEESSCWIRVAQMWSGNQWGMHFMPRIGQEVVVQFIDGDPDRPLIVGSLYNENNKTPYPLPGSQTRSGIKTRSMKGGENDYNELSFEDKEGSEEVYIQAQKDLVQNIKNNMNLKVGNNHELTATNNSSVKAGKNLTQSAGSDATLNVGNDYSQTTTNNATVKVGNSLVHEVGGNMSMNSGMTTTITALESIVFQVGQTTFMLTEAGIVIKATSFEVV